MNPASVAGDPQSQLDVAPSSVEFVAQARRRRMRRSALESASLGVAAGLIAAAGAVLSLPGAAAPRAHLNALLACAAISALASAATWWVERAKKTDLALAAQLDQRLGRGGALSTSFEAGRRGEQGPVARWLERRALGGLDRRSLARALPGVGWIWLAPPAMGLALLALTLEAPGHGNTTAFGDAGGTSVAVQAGAQARAALERARQQAAAARGDAGLRAELLAAIDRAAEELERARQASGALPQAADPGGDLARQLAADRAALGAPSPGDGAGSGAVDTRSAGAGAGAAADGNKSGLANGPPERTMAGSNRSTAAADGARQAPGELHADSAGEAGTIAGRWWPERYDPVVQGWRRELAARRGLR